MSSGLAAARGWCTFLVVVDPGTNSSGPGAIPFSGSRLRLVGLDVVQQDAQRASPVVRAHALRGGSNRGGDTVEINSRDMARVSREMRLASRGDSALTGSALTPSELARAEARQAFVKPAITPQDKARYERLVAGKVEQRREAKPASPARDRVQASGASGRVDAGANADLDALATDVRFRFASHVARQLEGGKAAILRPERRDVLVAGAVRDGILPFDANLVIALVQDAARRGDLVTPATIDAPVNADGAAIGYNEGIRAYLMAVVSSMRIASMLPLVRVAGGPQDDARDEARAGSATAFAQATVAVLLAGLLLIGMVATLGT